MGSQSTIITGAFWWIIRTTGLARKVLTWKVTTSLNNSRGLVLRDLKVWRGTLRVKDTQLRRSWRASRRRGCCDLKDFKMQRSMVKVFLETEGDGSGVGKGDSLGLHLIGGDTETPPSLS